MSEDAFVQTAAGIEDMGHFWPLLAPIPTTSLPCAILSLLTHSFAYTATACL